MTQPTSETQALPLGLTAILILRKPACRWCRTEDVALSDVGYCEPCANNNGPTAEWMTE